MNQKNNLDFAFTKQNYILLLVGVALICAGLLLMIGGGSDDPTIFSDKIFDFQRLTLAPILLATGFIIAGSSIMIQHKKTFNYIIVFCGLIGITCFSLFLIICTEKLDPCKCANKIMTQSHNDAVKILDQVNDNDALKILDQFIENNAKKSLDPPLKDEGEMIKNCIKKAEKDEEFKEEVLKCLKKNIRDTLKDMGAPVD